MSTKTKQKSNVRHLGAVPKAKSEGPGIDLKQEETDLLRSKQKEAQDAQSKLGEERYMRFLGASQGELGEFAALLRMHNALQSLREFSAKTLFAHGIKGEATQQWNIDINAGRIVPRQGATPEAPIEVTDEAEEAQPAEADNQEAASAAE